MTSTIISNNTSSFANNLSHLSDDFKSSLDNYLQYQKGLSLLNNRYSFISNLQTGSFGKVTCALDIKTNQKVAIKALKKSINGVSLMANHEVSIMKSLGYHKNITQLLNYFETKKYHIMILEFADSGDLYDAIHNKTNLGLNLQTNHLNFINFINQLLDVIKYSHSKGIYHRDIKPENILLMNDGTIKLCDWGLSTKLIKSNDFNVGTEKYMAPEALIKENDDDFYYSDKIDFYSIGITLLFILFNKCPFRKAIKSDPNYSNFLKSKYFIYDFFTNINSTSFIAIIDMLIINRDLNGLNYLIENGYKNGFTIDQEHSINFLDQQDKYINSIINSFNNDDNNDNGNSTNHNHKNENNNNNNNNNNDDDHDSNENDVFLFDDYENSEIIYQQDDFINDNHVFDSIDSNINSNITSYNNTNVNPILIPTIQKVESNNIAGSILNSNSTFNTYNSPSLFDNDSVINKNNNSFINSFELSSNDIWTDNFITDMKFK
jgi:serine/threonine protein kinase